jgi:hypothetical protein
MRTRVNKESIVAIELHREEAKALYENLSDRDNWTARLLLENLHQQEELIRKRAKTAIFRRLGNAFYYVLLVGLFAFIVASRAWQKPFNEWKDILFPKHQVADTSGGQSIVKPEPWQVSIPGEAFEVEQSRWHDEQAAVYMYAYNRFGHGAPRYGSPPYQKKHSEPPIILYYPVARGSVINATMGSILAGRSLHWVTPADRARIIKSWQSENPSLTLKLGSYQNPFWIPPVTSFSGDYEAQLKKLPEYSWYTLNWSVKQKIQKH